MASACSSAPCTHKILVDERNDELLRVKARNYDMQCEIERLKKNEEARIRDMQREMDRVRKQLEEARAELKETQAVLGQAFVSGSVGKRKTSVVEVDADEKPIPCHPAKAAKDTEKTLKRSRSPSIEIIEPPISFRNQPTAPNKEPPVVPKSDPAAVAPVSSRVDGEEMRRLAKRQKPEPGPEEPVVPVVTLAGRKALEQASVEAGASLTWKEKHEVVRAIASPPPEVKHVPVEDEISPKGAVDVSNKATATRPPIVKSPPRGSNSAPAAPLKETTKVPIASSSTSRTIKTERRPKGSSTALTLPLSVAETYLVSSTPLAIDPPPLMLEIPRKFLRLTYGGSDQQFLQYIPAETNPSGPERRRLMFPNLTLNPLMPSAPGMHGLVFASRREILNNGIWTVFCKRSNASPAVWLYVGEYENTLAGKMKAEEFSQQTLLVQREWATRLMDCKSHDCYVSMRARIALRIAGKLPVTNEIGEAKATEEERRVNDEITAVKNHRGLPVGKDDIIEAFCRGEEGINVVRMRCVAYDHVFAEDMRAKYLNYPALLKASKKKKGTKQTSAIGRGRAIRRKSDFVPSESDEDSSESDDDSTGSGDDFVGPSPTNARRATLKRIKRGPRVQLVT